MTNSGLSLLLVDGQFQPTQVELNDFGRWEVVQELGEGGYGKTFRAVSVDDGSEVALKVIHKELADSPHVLTTFENESIALQTIDSPWIVKYLGSGVSAGFPWIATELIDGPTLWDEIHVGRLTGARLESLALNLTGALVHAHEHKISHNDLKPSNIMFDLGGDGYVVIDFGIGQFQRIKGVRHDTFVGTPFYAAPEQHRGRSYVGSDVYSAGIVLLEAMTGVNPLRDGASPTVISSGVPGLIAESERVALSPVPLDAIEPRFHKVLAGMLDRDPVSRFTAVQARHEWETIFGRSTTQHLVSKPVQAPLPPDPFLSGKIQFESWREIERRIIDKLASEGFADFSLDVNTSSKMVVNFRAEVNSDEIVLVCPATGSRANLRDLGWRFDGPKETYSKRYSLDVSFEVFAKDVTAALQIGFGVRLNEVGLLL